MSPSRKRRQVNICSIKRQSPVVFHIKISHWSVVFGEICRVNVDRKFRLELTYVDGKSEDAWRAGKRASSKNAELLHESGKLGRRKRLLTCSFARTAHNRVFYARTSGEKRSNAKAGRNIDWAEIATGNQYQSRSSFQIHPIARKRSAKSEREKERENRRAHCRALMTRSVKSPSRDRLSFSPIFSVSTTDTSMRDKLQSKRIA